MAIETTTTNTTTPIVQSVEKLIREAADCGNSADAQRFAQAACNAAQAASLLRTIKEPTN